MQIKCVIKVEVPALRLKADISRSLKKEGFIKDFVVSQTEQPKIIFTLKYTATNERYQS